MASGLHIHGERVWLKHYPRGGLARRLVHGLLNRVVGALGADCLRAPPHRGGDAGRDVERRRIELLRAQGVHVPEVIGQGPAMLLLGDIGRSVSHHLRRMGGDPERIGTLAGRAAQAIAAAHRRGAYLGQAFPRNMTVDGERIGFIDFQEDPGEIMPLAEAQARDWLMFAVGVGRYYDGREDALAALLGGCLRELPQARAALARTVARLGFVERACYRLGRGPRAYGVALRALRLAVA